MSNFLLYHPKKYGIVKMDISWKKYCHKSPFGHISTIAIGENRVVITSKLIDAFRL